MHPTPPLSRRAQLLLQLRRWAAPENLRIKEPKNSTEKLRMLKMCESFHIISYQDRGPTTIVTIVCHALASPLAEMAQKTRHNKTHEKHHQKHGEATKSAKIKDLQHLVCVSFASLHASGGVVVSSSTGDFCGASPVLAVVLGRFWLLISPLSRVRRAA